MKNPSSELARRRHAPGANPVSVSMGLSTMIVATRAGLNATRDGVAAVRVLAAGLSWLVVALAAVAVLIRRRGERQVLVEQGRSSLELTALSLVESVLPVGAGAARRMVGQSPFVSAIVGDGGVGPRPLEAVSWARRARDRGNRAAADAVPATAGRPDGR